MIKVREVKARDRGNIYEMMQQDDRFKPGELEAILHRIDSYLFDADQRLFKAIIAENQKKELRGYAVYGPDPQAINTYQIFNLIHSPFIENGEILLNLLQFIENDILKNKGRIIVGEISSSFQYRNQFETYLKHKFNLSSVINNFYSEGEDKLILSKNISTK